MVAFANWNGPLVFAMELGGLRIQDGTHSLFPLLAGKADLCAAALHGIGWPGSIRVGDEVQFDDSFYLDFPVILELQSFLASAL